MRSVTEEVILAVPRERLAAVGLHAGVTLGEAAGAAIGSILQHGDFLPRSQVERDASLLQPIPCTVLRAGAAFLTLRRGEANRSSPLHGRYVIWMGGHVRVQDSSLGRNLLEASLLRELEEELSVTPNLSDFLGIIAPPGSLHLGILFDSTISPTLIPDVMPNTEFLTPKARAKRARFLTLPDLAALYPRLDIWSKLVLRDVYHYRLSASFDGQLGLWRLVDPA